MQNRNKIHQEKWSHTQLAIDDRHVNMNRSSSEKEQTQTAPEI